MPSDENDHDGPDDNDERLMCLLGLTAISILKKRLLESTSAPNSEVTHAFHTVDDSCCLLTAAFVLSDS